MATTGRTGSDAVFQAVHKVVHTLSKYGAKFRQTADIMLAGGTLNAAEHAVIVGFLDSLNALDSALKKMADYSGF